MKFLKRSRHQAESHVEETNQPDGNPVSFQSLPNNTNEKWWLDSCLRWNVLHCMGLCCVTFMNGYDGSLFNGLQSMTEWEEFLDYPSGARLGGITASLYIPTIFVSWLADIIAERFGRRVAIWTGATIVIVGAIVNSAAINIPMYVAGRSVIGVGTALCLTTAPTLLQEIAHPRYRSKIAGFYTCIYYIASVTASWVCFGSVYLHSDYSWRVPSYLQAVGPLMIILLTATCPESPRWLIRKGRHEEALRVLSKYHANDVEDDPLVQYEYREITTALRVEQDYESTSYLDFLKTPANRHRLIILLTVGIGTNWVGNGVVSFYFPATLRLAGVTNSVQQLGINAGLQVWNLIISTSAALLVERLGRRFLWLFSDIGMFIWYIFITGLSGAHANSGNASLGIAVIPFFFLFFGHYDCAWTPLQYAYPVEVLPYNMRMKGMALFIVIQFAAAVLNIFVNPIALENIGWKYYGVFLGLQVILITVTWIYFVETKNLTIEEISTVFERTSEAKKAAIKKLQGDGGKTIDTSSHHVETARRGSKTAGNEVSGDGLSAHRE